MSLITAAAFASGLLFPVDAGPPPQRPIILALNPQPEPPGRSKIKRIYIEARSPEEMRPQ